MNTRQLAWIGIGVSLLAGLENIITNIRNISEGISVWWSGLTPGVQWLLIGFIIYLLIRKDKEKQKK